MAQALTLHATAPLLVGYRGSAVFKLLLEADGVSPEELRGSVADELIPWTLGFAIQSTTGWRVDARSLPRLPGSLRAASG